MPKFKPKFALICDDIRVEDNHKSIIIGVYTGDIQVNSFPCSLALCCWVSIEMERHPEPVEIEVKLRIEFEDGSDPFETSSIITIDLIKEDVGVKGGTIELPLRIKNVAFDLSGAGSMHLYLRKKGGRWSKLLRKEIISEVN